MANGTRAAIDAAIKDIADDGLVLSLLIMMRDPAMRRAVRALLSAAKAERHAVLQVLSGLHADNDPV